jgi:starch-binding outer membrane protein, SusD/RagB family
MRLDMKLSNILLITALALSLGSCKKLIEIKETDFIGGDIALKTVANNEQAVIGAYALMGTEMDILLNAIASDEVNNSEFYGNSSVHEWTYSSVDISIRDNFTAINPLYRIIDRVNRVIRALPNADSTRTGDITLKSKLKGEAHFMRAFCHFQAFRYYCSNYSASGLAMPYMEAPSLIPAARIDMGSYFQKLNADLDTARSLLSTSLTDIYRTNRIAVIGLQARVALYTNNWERANTYSTEFINAIALASKTDFPRIWTDASNAELAFKLARNTGTRIGSLFRNTSANATTLGTVLWVVSNALWNSFDQTNDIRFASYVKNEPLLANAGRPSRIVQKYAGGAYGSSSENVADGKVFRTGEMYLIRAEAKAEANDLAGAASDINALRAARINGYTDVSFATKEEAITAIIQERFKELAFEGNRFWDLKRKGLPVSRLAADAPTAGATTLAANDYRFTLPIPDAEIKANTNMTQNPGY